MIEIKGRFSMKILFTSSKETIKEALEDANLRGANLGCANLEDANLRGANLGCANLEDDNLRGANLEDANLRGANLRGANLEYANLEGANLGGANLEDANLRGANLEDANLEDANLGGANLEDANLRDANLRGANLEDANLEDANLRDANLRGAGNRKELRTMQIDTYNIGFTKDTLQIGCKRFSIEEWKNFNDDKISKMDSNSLEWWNKWKEFVFKAIELSYGENKNEII